MDEQVERELKFDVPDGWQLPDAAVLTPPGGTVRTTLVDLSSAYFDTAHRDLLRSGVTLRRRTGDIDTGWHLKVPSGEARTEIRMPLSGEDVPDELRTLVRGLTGNAPLEPVAVVDTQRRVHTVVARDGAHLVEIADDTVAASAGGGDPVQWREVEIELGSGDEKLLRAAARWITDAGARPAAVGSKLARALGPMNAPPRPDGTLSALVANYLHEQHRALVQGDIDLRMGRDVVHRTRVATRRFRSVLRVLATILPAGRATALDAELKWYAELLGAARDVEVMREHLRTQIADLPPELRIEALAACVEQALDGDAEQAGQALREALDSERYATLLREVRAFVEDVRELTGRPQQAVREFADAATKKARKRLRTATRRQAPDADRHRARKAAKRARYAAELAEPALGKSARKQVKKHKRVQNQLGALQDAVVASAYLRNLAASVPDDADSRVVFAVGVLWQREQQRMSDARAAARDLARGH